MAKFWAFLAVLGALAASPSFAAPSLDFTAIKLGNAERAMLVVGGIQGDEPGGFSAATLLATRYEIQEGELIVVPNLNFPSIIRRSRGLHGDMNRKFARLDESDPEFSTVRRIQDLISQERIFLVLNLHDGSGFYRPSREDNLRNPSRWGQSIIIDQENLDDDVFMRSLHEIATNVAAIVNKALINAGHAIHVRNTRTAEGDREMEKSLSYYAVRKKKAAFGLEASKEFPVALRAYYHLVMIECFMELAGLRFSRDFELTPAGIEKALRANLDITFAENRIFLPLDNARNAINYLPLPRDGADNAITSKPIMAVVPCADKSGRLCVHYGNRTLAYIRPDWHESDDSIDGVWITVDGKEKLAPFGHVIDVHKNLKIRKTPGYRINAIGYGNSLKDESEIVLARKDFDSSFSVDRDGRLFRVEVYRGKKFSGMFLARFGKTGRAAMNKNNLPDVKGRESKLGY